MELIAASRIVKAQNRVTASKPYAEAITAVVSAVASQTAVAHPLTTPRDNPRRAAVLLVSSDRGLAGAYSASVLRMGEELNALLRSEGKEPIAYLTGRKAASYYRFRGREIAGQWTGFSEEPTFEAAKEAAEELIAAFVRGSDNEVAGVDEIHIVYTEYVSALTQRPVAKRVLPLAVDVGEALVSYLRRRPRCESRALFVRMTAPLQGLAPHTIGWIVRESCTRAGLPRVGAHRLRHTAATEMLRQGASLAEIGQVLRHREQKTTAIYAKVDRRALRALARPWPSQEGGAA